MDLLRAEQTANGMLDNELNDFNYLFPHPSGQLYHALINSYNHICDFSQYYFKTVTQIKTIKGLEHIRGVAGDVKQTPHGYFFKKLINKK